MSSTRQNKVARLVQKDLADIFQHEGFLLAQGTLITVTEVKMSPDLGVAKIYLSMFPQKNRETHLKKIIENKRIIRVKLGVKLKHQLRIVPELIFYIDDTLERAARIDELLKK